MSRDATESDTIDQINEYEFDQGDVFNRMGDDYWTVTARLWYHDAKEIARSQPFGETYEVAEDRHRREYKLTILDPRLLGGETQQLREFDLMYHFQEDSAAETREHYQDNRPEPAKK